MTSPILRALLGLTVVLLSQHSVTAGTICYSLYGSTQVCCKAGGGSPTGGTWANNCDELHGAGGHICPDTHTDCCEGVADYCVTRDCQGSYGSCDSNCEKTFTITQTPSSKGKACPPTKTSEGCAPGVGACPAAPEDCEGSYGTCDSNCEKTFTITKAPTNGGKTCPPTKTSEGCAPGVGACPAPEDCEGSYGTCDSNCEKTFTITKAPTNGGKACPPTKTSEGCTPGVAPCPCSPFECAPPPGCAYTDPVYDSNQCVIGCGVKTCDEIKPRFQYSIDTELTFPSLTIDSFDSGRLQDELEDLLTGSMVEIIRITEGSAIADVKLWMENVTIADAIFEELELIQNDANFSLLNTSTLLSGLSPTFRALLQMDGGYVAFPSVQLLAGLLAALIMM